MSAMQRSILALALMLAAVMGIATPAAAQIQRGIWVDPGAATSWTLTAINLTNYPLLFVSNDVVASPGQRPPFNGIAPCDPNDTSTLCLPLAPYRNVTWKSNTPTVMHPTPSWNGTFTFLPQGMDPKWTVTLNFLPYAPKNPDNPVATWVYVTADFNANPDWLDIAPYNISCSYPDWYNKVYNVMTLSGTGLAVTLYAPHINTGTSPSVDVTLVFRQRWPHTQLSNDYYQDSLVMPCLRYQDNRGNF